MRISGVVVDEGGRPVAGAEIATYWGFDAGKSRAHAALTSGADGRFDGRVSFHQGSPTLVVYSADRRTGAMHPVAERRDLRIRLVPTRRVRGRFVCRGFEPTRTIVQWYRGVERQRFADFTSDVASFDFRLPPGSYWWRAYGTGLRQETGRVVVRDQDVDLGEVRMTASILGTHRGKELPTWTVTAARGVEPGKTSLAGFRGKWVLVEFWGYS